MSDVKLKGEFTGSVDAAALPEATSTTPGAVVGLKQYVGGVDFSIVGEGSNPLPAGWNLRRAIAIPYQTLDGAWRMQFNLSASITSSTAAKFSITGITTKNDSNYFQVLATLGTGVGGYAYMDPNNSKITWASETPYSNLVVNGDIELDSKPTWAD
jgi:hypothetical protein